MHQMNYNDPMDAFMGSFFESVLQSKPKKAQTTAMAMDDIMNIIGGGLGMNMTGNIHTINMAEMPPEIIFGATNIPGLHKEPEPEEVLEDIHINHEIEFEESRQWMLPILVSRIVNRGQIKNNKENEKIYLTIPKGVDDDEIITIENKGPVSIINKVM